MNSRKIGFELGRALSLATVCVTVSMPAHAQDAATDPGASGASATVDAGATGSLDPAAPPAEEPAPAPAEPAAEPEPAPPPEPAPAPPVAKPEEAKAPTTAPNTWGVEQLSIVQTPWSAYPSAYVRGITYGSLWRTFHGQQWPYMPADDDKLKMQIGLGGYLWNDLSTTQIAIDDRLNTGDQTRWVSQTRGVLRVTPTFNVGKGFFVQGNGEFVVQGDMRPDPSSGVLATTDDVWVRFGKWNLFDVTFGRFQGWEIANHFGMGLDWATLERQGAWVLGSSLPKPTDGYGLDYFWDRQNFLLGGYAAHIYPTKWLRGEIMGHIGAGSGNATNPYQFDLRASGIFDVGFLKVKGGYEFGAATPQDRTELSRDRKNGWGVAAQVVLAPYVEFGGSFAEGYQDVIDKEGFAALDGSNTVQSWGGFANISPGHEPLVIGGGFFYKSYKNFRISELGVVDSNEQMLAYGAIQYTLWKQLYVKLVVSHASNQGTTFRTGTYINNSLGGRLRVEYLF